MKEGYEIAIDDGPWFELKKPGLAPESVAGVTLAEIPGDHKFAWRFVDSSRWKQYPPGATTVTVPVEGYLAINLHRWPLGIPSSHKSDLP